MTDKLNIFGDSFENRLSKIQNHIEKSSQLFMTKNDQREKEIDQQIAKARLMKDPQKAKWLIKSLEIDKQYCQKLREIEERANRVLLEDARNRMQKIMNG